MEPKTGKRIVSKGEYVRFQVKRTALWICGFSLGLSTLLGGVLTLGCGIAAVACLWYFRWEGIGKSFICLAGMGVAGALTQNAGNYGSHILGIADTMNEVLPLTRANTADLPAPDTLVRASAEPVQEPQTVLLRAAAGSLVHLHRSYCARGSNSSHW